MGQNRQAGQNGTTTDAAPQSRSREIAARGHAPSAAYFGSLIHASIADVLLGGIDRRDAMTTFSGVRAFVGVARNREAIDDLCREMGDAEIARIEAERAQLVARLAELDGCGISGRSQHQ